MSGPVPKADLHKRSVTVETIPAGQTWWRCHDYHPADSFHPGPGQDQRFSFFGDPPVSVWYAGQTPEAALNETVMHDLVPGSAVIAPEDYVNRTVSPVVLGRDARVVMLYGSGLQTLRLNAHEITSTRPSAYRDAIAWAQMLHAHDEEIDGLVWMCRTWNHEKSLVLFGDRFDVADLSVDPSQPPRPLAIEPHLSWLIDVAETNAMDVDPPFGGIWPV